MREEVLWACNPIAERLLCIARLDDQHFALAVQAMEDVPAIEASARRLLAALCKPVTVGRLQVCPTRDFAFWQRLRKASAARICATAQRSLPCMQASSSSPRRGSGLPYLSSAWSLFRK